MYEPDKPSDQFCVCVHVFCFCKRDQIILIHVHTPSQMVIEFVSHNGNVTNYICTRYPLSFAAIVEQFNTNLVSNLDG